MTQTADLFDFAPAADAFNAFAGIPEKDPTPQAGRRYWLVIASADHVARGRADGFMQACHGKVAPLKRMKPGDGVVYYSPTGAFRGKDRLQAFTAIGTVADRASYSFDMGGGFVPARRDVDWLASEIAPIQPLLDRLELTAGKRNWAFPFRFGFLALSEADFGVIAAAMGAKL